ncbi:MAG: homocysteine S-methyltransferase family protein [Bryobacteraceae bacterium]
MNATVTRSRTLEFRRTFGRRAMPGDGAMGTMLIEQGVPVESCFDELNLSSPAAVSRIHCAYVRAGAGIIATNTFGANRERLSTFGLGEKVAEINQAGVRLAREAAGSAAFVAGAVGPLGGCASVYREQIGALVEAGVDLLLLETFYSLAELREAVQGARLAAGPAMVIVAHVTVDADALMRDGATPEKAAREMDAWPVDGIGCNCSTGPEVVLETVARMRPLSSKPLSAMPNAGLPRKIGARAEYSLSPDQMAGFTRRFCEEGVRWIGGCCGTTPAHIEAAAGALRGSY